MAKARPALSLDMKNLDGFVSAGELERLQPVINGVHKELEAGTCPGSDYLGWLHLPAKITDAELAKINKTAERLQDLAEAVVVIGIGGSYLGARATIDGLGHAFGNQVAGPQPEIYYAGHQLSGEYMRDLLEVLKGKSLGLIVISKSGTTTEPGVAFRVLKSLVEDRHGKDEAKKRIVAITDRKKGALKTLAKAEGYTSFVIPDNIGGRYSVLTPVGLLPIATAGLDIKALVVGAREMEKACKSPSIEKNLANQYAAMRSVLYSRGYHIEVLANFIPYFHNIGEWWKQLSGESEGKDGRGIFPASLDLTTDLHSMGQYMQEGKRVLFETFLLTRKPNRSIKIPSDKSAADGLEYLAGKSLDYVNERAYRGTAQAHTDGGVPNLAIVMDKRDERCLGALYYMLERAIAVTCRLNRVNPFDQPGVEAYKRNMFLQLGKPGVK